METATSTEPTAEERADLYRWFSSVFARELDAEAWRSHVGDEFLAALDEQAGELGLEEEALPLRSYLVTHGEDDADEAALALAVDYARLFVGPGPGEAPPYESVYTSPKGRLYADAYADVVEVLKREQIGVSQDFHAPADHAAVELSIMAYLVGGNEEGEESKAPGPAKAGEFLGQHILNWFPKWASDIDEHAETDFYRGVTRFMMGFLQGEADRLGDGIAS